MKKMGYKRPTCKECGLVELAENNLFVWKMITEYPLATIDGYGSWRINIELCRLLAEEYLIIPLSEFVKRVFICYKYLFGAMSNGEGN